MCNILFVLFTPKCSFGWMLPFFIHFHSSKINVYFPHIYYLIIAVAKTSRNERSSRSHFIFRLSIYSYNEKMEMCAGALNIIDLASSEAAYSDATKEVQAEAKTQIRSNNTHNLKLKHKAQQHVLQTFGALQLCHYMSAIIQLEQVTKETFLSYKLGKSKKFRLYSL
ncbi:hypothetical protein PVAP13_9NG009751 [Panicum virgatum]|uniref:Kinesin motor domain-containing protein n=1 Tax=Panicum virgatum TaxID=38727 RepID=A0A8T0MB58_PANVG|nr:hypothetical protein PVAP13_9NG009751 [Panicum virgatum]